MPPGPLWATSDPAALDTPRGSSPKPLLDKGLSRVQHEGMRPPTTILLVDDEPGIRRSLGEALKDEGYQVVKAERGEQAIDLLHNPDGESLQLMLLDVWLPGQDGLETLKQAKQIRPDLPVVMISGHASIDTALQATKLGAFDFLEKPIDLDRLLLVVGNALRQSKLERENQRLLAEVEGGRFFLADSPAMRRLMADVALVAPTEGRVLLTGENGSGKEEVARLLHLQSPRKDAPFIEVNCAAIPEELIESELFGHQKGAFTGAIRDQKGKFREADGGTLFLDEIGDMSLKTQAKVLRALQEGRVEPVGGGGAVGVDVRVIAATNKPLEAAVAAKQFREDLFYRLNVVRIHIPPLRDRRDDIPLLVNYFLKKISREQQQPPKSIAASVIKTLEKYHWPGNVRELENAVRRAIVMAKSDAILLGDLPPEISGRGGSGAPPLSTTAGVAGNAAATDAAALARQLFQWARRDPKLKIIPAVERELVIQALKETADNQVHAAKLLGITRATLRKRIDKFGITRELTVK